MDRSRGQACADYVALMAVVAVVLAVGARAAVATGAPGLANAVVGRFRVALCIVSGADCRTVRPHPCVVHSTRDTRHVAISIVLVRVDEDHVLLRERLSDGSVRLETVERDGAGLEAGLGATLGGRLGPLGAQLGAQLRAALLGVLGRGRVYVARGEREADALARELGRHPPPPDADFVEGGARALVAAGLNAPGASVGLEETARGALGARRDRRTREVTLYLRAGGAAGLLASALMGSDDRVSGADALLALTLDRHRRPVELALMASGALRSGGERPGSLGGLLSGLGGGAAKSGAPGSRWELDARVDLTDPDVAAAWAAYRHAPARPEAIRALGERLRARARLDARAYRTTTSTQGVRGSVALGIKLGGEFEHTVDRSDLVAAASRPPGGVWERREDCLQRSR